MITGSLNMITSYFARACPHLKARCEALVVEPLLELALRQLADERHAHCHPHQLKQTETQTGNPG